MTTPHRFLAKAELQIHRNLQSMTRQAISALESAMNSLKRQDAEVAQEVIVHDVDINSLQRQIERECLQVIATLEPKARDLREVIASLQIATELERIADHAKDIGKIVLEMDGADFSGPMDRISAMGSMCRDMLAHVMEAFENADVDSARSVAAEDRYLDEFDEETAANLLMSLMTGPDCTMHNTHLLWIAYHLERIGDRITNIAERIAFMAEGDTPDLG